MGPLSLKDGYTVSPTYCKDLSWALHTISVLELEDHWDFL